MNWHKADDNCVGGGMKLLSINGHLGGRESIVKPTLNNREGVGR